MTRDDIDTLWQQALHESVAAGEQFTRYRFAALIEQRAAAAEREACARLCDSVKEPEADWLAQRIRARGEPCF